jgi:hypothetical protein
MIMGNLAIVQAKSVGGLQIADNEEVTIQGDPKNVIEQLVQKYAAMFGETSIDECREALMEVTPHPSEDMLPEILKQCKN